jgi:hypothetical protein
MTRYPLELLLAVGNSARGRTELYTFSRKEKNHLKSLGIFHRDGLHLSIQYGWKQTGRRYDPALPNRKFKHDYIKSHGSTRGLHDLRRTPHFEEVLLTKLSKDLREILSDRPYTGSVQAGRLPPPARKRGSKLGPRETRMTSIGPVTFRSQKSGHWARYGLDRAQQYDLPVGKVTRRGRLVTHEGNEYLAVLGGRTVPFRHHKKYWYFLRTRGSWRTSEHHPYGDEIMYLADPYLDPYLDGVQTYRQ